MHEDLLRQFVRDRAAYLGYLFVLTRDAHLAEDLIQEAFLVVSREVGRFDRTKDFAAWVRGICRNLAHAGLRKKQRLQPALQPELEAALERAFEADDPVARAARSEQLINLNRCLERLAQPIRELLASRYGQDESLEQLGQRTGKSPKAIQMMLSRVRHVLARCVKGEGEGAAYGA